MSRTGRAWQSKLRKCSWGNTVEETHVAHVCRDDININKYYSFEKIEGLIWPVLEIKAVRSHGSSEGPKRDSTRHENTASSALIVPRVFLPFLSFQNRHQGPWCHSVSPGNSSSEISLLTHKPCSFAIFSMTISLVPRPSFPSILLSPELVWPVNQDNGVTGSICVNDGLLGFTQRPWKISDPCYVKIFPSGASAYNLH